jgi:hypothetical protein
MEQEIANAPAKREAELEELRRKREAHQIKLEENARNAFNFTEEQRTAANERLEPVFDEYRDHGDVGKLQEAIILALKQSPEPIRDAFMDNYFGADKVLDEGEAAKWASLYYKSKDQRIRKNILRQNLLTKMAERARAGLILPPENMEQVPKDQLPHRLDKAILTKGLRSKSGPLRQVSMSKRRQQIHLVIWLCSKWKFCAQQMVLTP